MSSFKKIVDIFLFVHGLHHVLGIEEVVMDTPFLNERALEFGN
jgi:hypothetical protein